MISVIIRTYNEEKRLAAVLHNLSKQTYKDFEVIIVDSESTDRTLEIAHKFGCKIVNIKKSDFNYSYASNIGAKNASGEILVYISGHSVPKGKRYLEEINKTFADEHVGGAYGEVLPFSDAGFIEWWFYFLGFAKSKLFSKKLTYDNQIHPGILSCSNAAIRKNVWDRFQFREEAGNGGEDVLMAWNILNNNLKVVKNKKMVVYHSHGKNIEQFKKELENWKIMYNDVLRMIDDDLYESKKKIN